MQAHSHGHSHGHGHAHGGGHGGGGRRQSRREARDSGRVRTRALVLLAVVLVPLAVATVAGLVVWWPEPAKRPALDPASTFAAPGVSFPQGTVTAARQASCDAGGGSGGGAPAGSGGSGSGASPAPAAGGRGAAGGAPPVPSCGQLAVRISDGPDRGKVEQVQVPSDAFRAGVHPGQGIRLVRIPGGGGVAVSYQFVDFSRKLPVAALALAFAVVVVAVARLRGLAAVAGLAVGAAVIGWFMVPALLAGEPALGVGLVAGAAIMFPVLYLAHGFSTRTTTALLGTLFGLALTAGLGTWATSAARLTGLGSEDNVNLAAAAPGVRLSGIVLCGLIVAGLGVLNDVTVTQASAVWELHESAPEMPARRLFSAAMRIGRDHIASTVYTLAFAYVGAALSVLLLISAERQPLGDVIFSEALAEELVRTLIGSIGLVLAIPLTTLTGVAVVKAVSRRPGPPHAPPSAPTGAAPSAGAAGRR